MVCFILVLFFFNQKTAYEMRISDWSSDVCSSDLLIAGTDRGRWLGLHHLIERLGIVRIGRQRQQQCRRQRREGKDYGMLHEKSPDRKSVVSGKSVSVRVHLGCLRLIKNQPSHIHNLTPSIPKQPYTHHTPH